MILFENSKKNGIIHTSWRKNMDDIKINDVIKVVVTGIQKYGAFVLINDKYDGLIHISEISSGYVKNINDYIKIGDKIFAQVVDIDDDNNKFKLSIKNIDYRNDGKVLNDDDDYSNGFEPLKENLDLWINEKIKEIMDKM
jgi:general stress protein 13